jgi:antagonist of KipI
MGVCEVLRKGGLTTIQDLGRHSYMRYAVSPSGAMDQFALRIGNLLAGNADDGLAGIEVTLIGPKLRARDRIGIAITGADLSPKVNNKEAPMWRFLVLEPGDELSFGTARAGCRAYVCFTGGVAVPTVMASRSTQTRAAIGGIPRPLSPGDLLPVCVLTGDVSAALRQNVLRDDLVPAFDAACCAEVIRGPQEAFFTADSLERFYASEYTVTPESDRMGYRLDGPKILRIEDSELITEATPPGSVQISHDGRPIILMVDAAVTGGYPKIAVVSSVSRDCLAQARPGHRIRFRKIELDAAHRSIRDRERAFQSVREAMARIGVTPPALLEPRAMDSGS